MSAGRRPHLRDRGTGWLPTAPRSPAAAAAGRLLLVGGGAGRCPALTRARPGGARTPTAARSARPLAARHSRLGRGWGRSHLPPRGGATRAQTPRLEAVAGATERPLPAARSPTQWNPVSPAPELTRTRTPTCSLSHSKPLTSLLPPAGLRPVLAAVPTATFPDPNQRDLSPSPAPQESSPLVRCSQASLPSVSPHSTAPRLRTLDLKRRRPRLCPCGPSAQPGVCFGVHTCSRGGRPLCLRRVLSSVELQLLSLTPT
jgi:hypothetical protein